MKELVVASGIVFGISAVVTLVTTLVILGLLQGTVPELLIRINAGGLVMLFISWLLFMYSVVRDLEPRVGGK